MKKNIDQEICFVCESNFTPKTNVNHTHPADKDFKGEDVEICPGCFIDYINAEDAILTAQKRHGR